MKNNLNKKKSTFLFKISILILIICIFLLGTLLGIYLYIYNYGIKKIYYTDSFISEYPVAIVFGAGYYKGGKLSAILQDRVDTAIELYKKGFVKKILMTGANNTIEYDEPTAMINYAVKKGIPKKDLKPDYAGFRTYDSIYRAKEIFGVENAVLVTQKYHLFRCLYIAKKIGINAIGISSDKQRYLKEDWYETREFFAIILSFVETNIIKPEPRFLGDKEYIIYDE